MKRYSTLHITTWVSICALLLSNSAAAENTQPSNMIQFKNYVTTNNKAHATSERVESEIFNIDQEKMSKKISDIRKGICEAVKPGAIELWIAAGAEGSIFVLNSHADAGIKITIQCNN